MEPVRGRYIDVPLADVRSSVDKRFFEPTEIERWVIVIYEQQRRFGQQNVDGLINGLKDACRSVGSCTQGYCRPVLTNMLRT